MPTLDEYLDLPSVMYAEDEIRVIQGLMEMSREYIADNIDQFNKVVSDLDGSHMDGGAYGIRRSNEQIFLAFADWLDEIYDELGVRPAASSETFRVSFDDMVKEYPSMAEWDDDPPMGK